MIVGRFYEADADLTFHVKIFFVGLQTSMKPMQAVTRIIFIHQSSSEYISPDMSN